jgi:hypothetical protein
LHIIGAVLLFVLLTIEGVGLRQGFAAARLNRILGPISAVTILVPGLYMGASEWGWKGWIIVGIAAWVLIAVAGAATGISVLTGRLNTRAAALSWSIRVGAALGVMFIMTIKPDATSAAIAVLVGAVIGGVAGSAGIRRFRSA